MYSNEANFLLATKHCYDHTACKIKKYHKLRKKL